MIRIGFGYDIHPLESGRKLYIGGVEVPFDKGAVGHSDGDVLIHAICDALLGAVGFGDIGKLFPDTDDKYKNARSEIFLKKVGEILRENKCKVINIDSTVVLEKPKIAQFTDKMREKIASVLEIEPNRVSVKAKRNEGFGDIGSGKAIGCYAVAMVET